MYREREKKLSRLEELGKEVQAFIKDSYELTSDYKNIEADLQEKVRNGLRGQVEVNQELENKQQELKEALGNGASKLKEKVEEVRTKELQEIEETSDSVTADTLAELNLLSQLDLTNSDVEKYINKYKHNPLALRRLQEISKDKRTLNQFPPNREEYLNTILGRMDTSINRFKQLKVSEHDVKIKMIADGAIRSIEEDLNSYRSL